MRLFWSFPCECDGFESDRKRDKMAAVHGVSGAVDGRLGESFTLYKLPYVGLW